jgi:hypothetical protein
VLHRAATPEAKVAGTGRRPVLSGSVVGYGSLLVGKPECVVAPDAQAMLAAPLLVAVVVHLFEQSQIIGS